MRYSGDLGCRYRGIPHDWHTIHENMQVKWERCNICGKRERWNKGYRGRTDNNRYLKSHVRNYAQQFGATKRIFNKIYHPEKTTIVI